MDRRAYRNRLVSRIDPEKCFGKLADLRQPLAQLFRTQVPQVEIDGRAVPRRNGASLALFVPESLAQPVTRAKFHSLVTRPWIGWPQTVILQVPIAILVRQDAAFPPAGFGE